MQNEWASDNMNGLAIVRVSSRRQEGGISHETQEKDIQEYCERNGIRLKEVIRLVESAYKDENRKKYTAAINKAVTHNIRHVLFYMFDREARNTTDTERNEKLIKADVVCIHYVRENKVLYKGSPDSDFFMRDVQAVTNKHYSRNLSTKVQDAMKQKAEGGWYPSNHVPLGYIVVRYKDENGRDLGSRPVRDPNEQNVKWVQREFELRAQGLSFEEIRKQIIAEKLIPSHKIKGYSKGSVEYRISNVFYEGKFTWQGIVYEGKHDTIIPPHILEQARQGRKRLWSLRPEAEHGIFGGGWIRCAECGCHIVYAHKRKTYRSGKVGAFHLYHCTNGRHQHDSMAGRYISEEELWTQLEVAVDRISIAPELAKTVADALNGAHKKGIATATIEIERGKAAIKEAEQKEDKAYDQLNAGVLDQEGFKRQVSRFREERRQANDRMQAAQTQISASFKETAESTLELCKHAKRLYLSRSPVEKLKLIQSIVLNPTLRGRRVEYSLRKPFQAVVDLMKSGEWWAHLDDLGTHSSAPHDWGSDGERRKKHRA